MADLGVAVIGCGSTAERRHLPVWTKLAGTRLVAVVSRDAARAQAAAQRYGAARPLTDWHDLLADPEVQVADICVPHPQHAEVAIAMARAGKHVLCEKPLAPQLSAARAMAAAARAAGTLLFPFHNMRLLGASSAAIRLVRAGRIGRPLLLRAVMCHGGPDATDPRRHWFLEAGSGGGAVLDLGPHLFDLVRALQPTPARRLRAVLLQPPDHAVERDGVVDVEFADGSLAALTLSWSQGAGRETSLVVHGTAGTLRVCLLQAPDPSPGQRAASLVLGEGWGMQVAVSYPEPEPDGEPCTALVRALAGEPPAVSADDGVEAIRWVDACYRSHATRGAWIDL